MTVYSGIDASRLFSLLLRVAQSSVLREMKHVHCGHASTAIAGEIGNNDRGVPCPGSVSLSPFADVSCSG
jgi:hypothetical protein